MISNSICIGQEELFAQLLEDCTVYETPRLEWPAFEEIFQQIIPVPNVWPTWELLLEDLKLPQIDLDFGYLEPSY